MDVDLQHLTLAQVVVTLFAIAFLDFLCGIGAALANGTLTVDLVAQWVGTHILQRVLPLAAAAAIGRGMEPFLPAIPAVWAIFLVGAAAYIAETLASIAASFGIRAAKATPRT